MINWPLLLPYEYVDGKSLNNEYLNLIILDDQVFLIAFDESVLVFQRYIPQKYVDNKKSKLFRKH